MKKCFLVFALSCISLTVFAQKEVTIKAGTPIPFQATNTVKAADVNNGEKLNFRVSRDIVVNGVTAIPYGTPVSAKVLKAKRSAWWGIPGRLEASITELVLQDGTVIPIQNGEFKIKGKNRTILSVALFWFVTIPACLITGSRAEMPAGYEVVGNTATTVNCTVE